MQNLEKQELGRSPTPLSSLFPPFSLAQSRSRAGPSGPLRSLPSSPRTTERGRRCHPHRACRRPPMPRHPAPLPIKPHQGANYPNPSASPLSLLSLAPPPSLLSTSFCFLLPSHTQTQPEEVFDGEHPWTPRWASPGGGPRERRRPARDRSRTRDIPPLLPLPRADAVCLRLHVAII